MTNITGTAGNDVLSGTADQDIIDGLGGDDHIDGGLGPDILYGRLGSDTLIGGDGDDFLGAYVDGTDLLEGGAGNDQFSLAFDQWSGPDTIVVPGSVATLLGGAGNDSFVLQLLVPSDAQVTIDGGGDSDRVFINGYRDMIVTLGQGQDVVAISENNSAYLTGDSGALVVTDFETGESGDRLDWVEFLHVTLADYDRRGNPFATGHLRLVEDGGDTIVQVDFDGSGTARDFIDYFRLEGVAPAALTAFNLGGYASDGSAAIGRVIVGTPAFDRLDGTAGDDLIDGLGSTDVVMAGAGDDLVNGGAGGDELYGKSGDDTLNGEAGDDTILGGHGNDTLDGGEGNDWLSDSDGGADALIGGVGADRLFVVKADLADMAVATLSGGDDADALHLYVHNYGAAEADGGSGDDIVHVYALRGAIDVTLGAGSDELQLHNISHGFREGLITVQDFELAPGGDRIAFDADFMSFFPGWDGTSPFESGLFRLVQSGADTLVEFDWHNDALSYLPLIRLVGIDASLLAASHLAGFAPGRITYLGTGDADSLAGTERGDILLGEGGDDQLSGLAGEDRLEGGSGADRLDGGEGADEMAGGIGNDLYLVDDAGDLVAEAQGGGEDRVVASIGYALAAGLSVEILEAAAGNAAIHLTGNAFGQTLIGNAGANLLNGGGGADAMTGLGGNDSYFIDDVADQAIEVGGEGNDTVYVNFSYVLSATSSLEYLSTTAQIGTAAINLTGNALNNILFGNEGANILTGGAGQDMSIGFGGNDSYIIDRVTDQIVETVGGGSDTVFAGFSYALTFDQEVEYLSTNSQAGIAAINFTGNNLSNTIFGNNGANVLNGLTGVDYLVGFAGNDTYFVEQLADRVFEAANGGNDTIYASASYVLQANESVEAMSTSSQGAITAIDLTGNNLVNTIFGNNGANTLNGGGGADFMNGFGGADTFAFTTALGAGNVDTIAGYSVADDTVALDDAVFAGIGPLGTLNINAFHTGAAAADGNDRIIYNSTTGQLFFDADGSGSGAAAVLFATIGTGLALTASDFTVI